MTHPTPDAASASRKLAVGLGTLVTAAAVAAWPVALRLQNCNWGFFGDYSPAVGHDVITAADIGLVVLWLALAAGPQVLLGCTGRHPPSRSFARAVGAVATVIIVGLAIDPLTDPDAYWTIGRCRG